MAKPFQEVPADAIPSVRIVEGVTTIGCSEAEVSAGLHCRDILVKRRIKNGSHNFDSFLEALAISSIVVRPAPLLCE